MASSDYALWAEEATDALKLAMLNQYLAALEQEAEGVSSGANSRQRRPISPSLYEWRDRLMKRAGMSNGGTSLARRG